MTTPDSAWFRELTRLATTGPEPEEYAAAAQFLDQAERLTNAARELIKPRATTPAKARLMTYSATSEH